MQRIVTILDTALTVNYNDRPISTQKDLDTYKFQFDESWQGFAKTAVFYTDPMMVRHVVLLEDNIATIPWEVLVGKPQVLYIGVFGVKDTKVKPTTFGAVRLREGSYIDGVAPLPPTPDVYQQIIGAWEGAKTEEEARVVNENSRKNNFDALVDEYNLMKAALEKEITDGTASVDALQVLEADYAAKALALEQTYAPELNLVKSQLAETQNQFDIAVGAIANDAEVVLARGTDTTLKNRLDKLTNGTGINDDALTPPKINKNDYLTEQVIELLNKDTLEIGFVDPAGNEQAGTTWRRSDFIPVTVGKQYQIYLKDSAGNLSFTYEAVYYNSSQVVLGTIQSQSMPYTWTAPANAAYLRVNFGLAYITEVYVRGPVNLPNKYDIKWLKVMLANLDPEITNYIDSEVANAVVPNPWVGKKANFLGTSITNGATLVTPATERFSELVKTGLGLAVANNYGLNGTRLANNITSKGVVDNDCFAIRYTAMTNDADLIYVECPTNDYGSTVSNGLYTAPFGVFADRVNSTFYGACHVLFKGLIEKYQGKKVIIVTDPHRSGAADSSADDTKLNPDTNKSFKDYINATKEVAEFYGLPVLDLSKALNINPVIAYQKTTYMPDGLHPTAAGHQLIANAIIKFTKQL